MTEKILFVDDDPHVLQPLSPRSLLPKDSIDFSMLKKNSYSKPCGEVSLFFLSYSGSPIRRHLVQP
jgi:hypothetical protein